MQRPNAVHDFSFSTSKKGLEKGELRKNLKQKKPKNMHLKREK